jgi:SAM-dependent methyltransferase
MSDNADRIIGLYERHAPAYDRDRGRTLFERPWLDRFTALIPRGGSVLDLGCGSGEPIARHLIEAGYRVTGVDPSAAMIGRCRSRFPDQTWTIADMRGLALGRRFDGILAWDSLFHLRAADQRAMFTTFAAHAAPGAALMFTTGPAAGETVGSYRGEPLYHASLDGAEYRLLLSGIGFMVAAQINNDPDCGGHTVWLARGSGGNDD